MGNYIILGILALIIAAAVFYVVKEKKEGAACIGYPHSKQCSGKCNK